MSRRIESPDTDADISIRKVLEREVRTCFVVNAGAGSGKTTSLVKALAYLRSTRGEELHRSGQQVACITYTRVAAEEIHLEIEDDPLFLVSTIHSFLWAVVKPFKRDISSWIADRIDEKILGLIDHNAKPKTRESTRTKNLISIDDLKQALVSLGSVTSFTYGSGSRYGEGILGHDDVIKMVPQLIMEKPLLRRLIARRFPFIFVDESQDTFPQVVAALRALSTDPLADVCIGFLGDPMQQIYATGAGAIELESDWIEIDKPENFRCPTSVLEVINSIRGEVPDSLLQTGGKRIVTNGVTEFVRGAAHLFVLPIDEGRERYITEVREWLAVNTKDEAWLEGTPESDVRILVIEHRLAARRLGFENLFAAHHDRSTEDLKSGVADGTAWTLIPLVEYLVPLAHASRSNQRFLELQLIRKNCVLISNISDSLNPSDLLSQLSLAVDAHAKLLFEDGNHTVRDVLQHAIQTGLLVLNEKYRKFESLLNNTEEPAEQLSLSEYDLKEFDSVSRFLDVPAKELLNYQNFLVEHSIYETHQGVKGSEFERVLILLEDDEAAGNLFSYDKLLGLQALSNKDSENITAGIESTIDRTRRLLYVGCSRAERTLAVTIFTSDTQSSVATLRGLSIFDDECVHDIESLRSQQPC